MPYARKRKTTRKTFKKRRPITRKKYQKKMTRRSLQRRAILPSYIPQSTSVAVRYNQIQTIAQTTMALPTYVYFRGNGAWDPQAAVGGQSPYMWSVYSLMYARYRCYACKISLRLLDASATTTDTVQVLLRPTLPANYASAADSWAVATNQPFCKTTYVQDFTNMGRTLKHYATTAKMFGIPRVGVSLEQDFSAVVTGGPVNDWDWEIGIQNSDLTSTASLNLEIKLKYYLTFYEPSRIEQA